jgi:hypothetical protein
LTLDGSDFPKQRTESVGSNPGGHAGRDAARRGVRGHWSQSSLCRVIAVHHGLPGPEIWLVLRRTPAGEPKAYLCNAPADTAPTRLVRMRGMRWTIETYFETWKQYLGLGDYEVRSWRGWHYHMTWGILALSFIVRLQGRLKKMLPPRRCRKSTCWCVVSFPSAPLMRTGSWRCCALGNSTTISHTGPSQAPDGAPQSAEVMSR